MLKHLVGGTFYVLFSFNCLAGNVIFDSGDEVVRQAFAGSLKEIVEGDSVHKVQAQLRRKYGSKLINCEMIDTRGTHYRIVCTGPSQLSAIADEDQKTEIISGSDLLIGSGKPFIAISSVEHVMLKADEISKDQLEGRLKKRASDICSGYNKGALVDFSARNITELSIAKFQNGVVFNKDGEIVDKANLLAGFDGKVFFPAFIDHVECEKTK